jgi:Bacterial pre-peptidase C-terminal domain
VNGTGGTLTLPALPAAGTYTVMVNDGTSYGSSATFALKLDAGAALVANATATNGTAGAGQSPRYTFSATAGQTFGIGLTNLVYTPSSSTTPTAMTLYKPDGTQIASASCYPSQTGCNVDLVNAPVTGTYSVVIDPPTDVTTATYTIQLSNPLAGALTLGSATGTTVATTRPGQNIAYTITATAGQNFGVGLSDVTINTPSTASYATMTVYQPSGAQVSSVNCYPTQGGCALYVNNAVAGTYSVVVTRLYAATGSAKLWANNDAAGALTANVAANVSLKSGQNARYSFAGTVGQAVGIEVSQLVTVPTGKPMQVYVYRPTDTIITYGYYYNPWQSIAVNGTGGTLTLPALPAAGTYTVMVNDGTSYGSSATFALKAILP